jgi:hypothetical protein
MLKHVVRTVTAVPSRENVLNWLLRPLSTSTKSRFVSLLISQTVNQSEKSFLKTQVHYSIHNSPPPDYPEPSKSRPSVQSCSFIYDLFKSYLNGTFISVNILQYIFFVYITSTKFWIPYWSLNCVCNVWQSVDSSVLTKIVCFTSCSHAVFCVMSIKMWNNYSKRKNTTPF